MDRLIHIGIGFVIAFVLMFVFFLVKDSLEDRKSIREQRMMAIAKKECLDLKDSIYWHNIIGFESYVNKIVDSKLAEKEGKE